jgi:hypothetical protein
MFRIDAKRQQFRIPPISHMNNGVSLGYSCLPHGGNAMKAIHHPKRGSIILLPATAD